MKKITALIPVRSGSERVKNKNIRPFFDTNLLVLKINQLKQLEKIDEIVVNSDCDEMLKIAKDMCVTPVKRDACYASSFIPMNEVWCHLAKNTDAEHILYTNCTSPLVKLDSYKSCIELYNNLPDGFDSLTTVHRIKEYLWHKESAINYDPRHHPRSQDLPEYYGLNFAISILPKALMIHRKSILGKKFMPYFLSSIESMDIDTQEDFDISEAIYEKFHKRQNRRTQQ